MKDIGRAPRASISILDRLTMGLYDRDYHRGGHYGGGSGYHLDGPMTLTTKVAIVMFGVYVVQLVAGPWFTALFRLYPDVPLHPWMGFQLLTYGFLHDVGDLRHILFNMLAFWLFGRQVEMRYGSREYLLFFLVAIVVAGLVWILGEFATNRGFAHLPPMLGASGGVTAIVILFALNYPHQTVLFMFVIPMPMWVLALLIVGMDLFGAMERSGNVAFTAHLGGAMFGFLYYQWGWRFERWLPSGMPKRPRRKPKLRVIDPDQIDSTDSRVDEILKKIQEKGQDSLTRGERRILQQASREYQKRRQ